MRARRIMEFERVVEERDQLVEDYQRLKLKNVRLAETVYKLESEEDARDKESTDSTGMDSPRDFSREDYKQLAMEFREQLSLECNHVQEVKKEADELKKQVFRTSFIQEDKADEARRLSHALAEESTEARALVVQSNAMEARLLERNKVEEHVAAQRAHQCIELQEHISAQKSELQEHTSVQKSELSSFLILQSDLRDQNKDLRDRNAEQLLASEEVRNHMSNELKQESNEVVQLQRTNELLKTQMFHHEQNLHGGSRMMQTLKEELAESQAQAASRMKTMHEGINAGLSQAAEYKAEYQALETHISQQEAVLAAMMERENDSRVFRIELEQSNDKLRKQLLQQEKDLEILRLSQANSTTYMEQQKSELEESRKHANAVVRQSEQLQAKMTCLCDSLQLSNQENQRLEDVCSKMQEDQSAAQQGITSWEGVGNRLLEELRSREQELKSAEAENRELRTELQPEKAHARSQLSTSSHARESSKGIESLQAQVNRCSSSIPAQMEENLEISPPGTAKILTRLPKSDMLMQDPNQQMMECELEIAELRAEVKSLKQQRVADVSGIDVLERQLAQVHVELQCTETKQMEAVVRSCESMSDLTPPNFEKMEQEVQQLREHVEQQAVARLQSEADIRSMKALILNDKAFSSPRSPESVVIQCRSPRDSSPPVTTTSQMPQGRRRTPSPPPVTTRLGASALPSSSCKKSNPVGSLPEALPRSIRNQPAVKRSTSGYPSSTQNCLSVSARSTTGTEDRRQGTVRRIESTPGPTQRSITPKGAIRVQPEASQSPQRVPRSITPQPQLHRGTSPFSRPTSVSLSARGRQQSEHIGGLQWPQNAGTPRIAESSPQIGTPRTVETSSPQQLMPVVQAVMSPPQTQTGAPIMSTDGNPQVTFVATQGNVKDFSNLALGQPVDVRDSCKRPNAPQISTSYVLPQRNQFQTLQMT
eukprot:gnl/MRDRNA2_/MRDRNA2_36399_c0_seq2.p1 gnl/MRDRNA2_/MRDRNA2_36399_c0~~gnl/MRDRNA2_/MRDRNA2_36399_c0_seq2.p1  ORF type:complete len:940 (+),score=206.06 gnl/MRDRNA2_/MRDRNA2_36399_c0_seq2:143-2962(+)